MGFRSLAKRFRIGSSSSDPILLICLLLVFAIPYFLYKIQSPFPNGFAGLYAFMAELIAQNGFSLPQTIPYYGAEGIPFAFPPLSFYVMAFTTAYLKVTPMVYMRFAPSVFLWLAILPMFLLVKEVTLSSRKAFIATILFGSSYGLIGWHYDAAGLCRGFALLNMLIGLYFSYRAFSNSKVVDIGLASLFFGLTLLSHLSYAVFFVLCVATFAFFGPAPTTRKLLSLVTIGLGGALLSSPWWMTVISRHGVQVFLNALNSHGNTATFDMLINSWRELLPRLRDWLLPSYETPILVGALVLGLLYALISREYFLPTWLLLTALVTSWEGERFVALVGSLLGASAIDELISRLSVPNKPRRVSLLALILITVGATLGAYYIRLGAHMATYSAVIFLTATTGLFIKLTTYFLFGLLSPTLLPPGGRSITATIIRKIALSVTISSVVTSLVLLVLFYFHLVSNRIPYTVIVFDWLLSIFLVMAYFYFYSKFNHVELPFSTHPAFPNVAFLLFLSIICLTALPRLYYINAGQRSLFFSQAFDLAAWYELHEPAEATYLFVPGSATPENDETEWFPFLLKRTPIICAYGSEWTSSRQQFTLETELSRCTAVQSLSCLEDFLFTRNLQADTIIIPMSADQYSIYHQVSGKDDWRMLFSNALYSVWQFTNTP